jgi:hypothetical protein
MLKAYRLNDCEAWAGETLEDAIKLAMSETGCTREEVFFEDYGEELPRTTIGTDDKGEAITVGEILDVMEAQHDPGLVWAWE